MQDARPEHKQPDSQDKGAEQKAERREEQQGEEQKQAQPAGERHRLAKQMTHSEIIYNLKLKLEQMFL